MAPRSWLLNEAMHDYIVRKSVREPEVLQRLRVETQTHNDLAIMQVGPEQGQFMALLVQLIGARQCLEIGTFTGYSALAVALALPPDGRLIACDISEEWTAVARRYWAEAGVGDKIDLRIAPATETLDRLIAEGASGRFDFAFIDADKQSYPDYYERCLTLMRPGGLIAVDNVFMMGGVVDPQEHGPMTTAIREFNDALLIDDRIDLAMLPVGDGLSLARKR